MPGMTANLTIPTASKENVLAVPNAALRFKPTLTAEQQSQLDAQTQARRAERAQGGQAKQGVSAQGDGKAQGQEVWVLVNGKQLERRWVRTGLSDGRVTEIIAGNLNEGDVIVTGENNGNDSSQAPRPTTPFGQRPGGFTSGRR
jgi:HlyD family secretion protein